jgi:putative endonuclease
MVSLYHVAVTSPADKRKKYKRMIERIRETPDAPADWSVYIVSCRDGSFYTGIAKDVDARVEAHNRGKGAAYTRARLPVALRYREDGFTRSAALSREAGIKSLSRPQKKSLIEKSSP